MFRVTVAFSIALFLAFPAMLEGQGTEVRGEGTRLLHFQGTTSGTPFQPSANRAENAEWRDPPQDGTIVGSVTDAASGRPLASVAVRIPERDMGAATDREGRYTLAGVPPGEWAVRVEILGYATEERLVSVVAGETVTVNFELRQQAIDLGEIVITGFGTQRREGVTGSIARVDRRVLDVTSVTSIDQALQGQAAGVFISQPTGRTGVVGRIQIRGPASITASSQPLFVVDGMPITTSSQTSGGWATNPLSDLNMEDIESIEILKDASAAAIYGSRASNGVILITTRGGVPGAPHFNVRYEHGWSGPTREQRFVTDVDLYREMIREAASNSGLDEDFIRANIPRWDDPIPENWPSRVWREDAGTQRVSVSGSGGSSDTRFFLSLGYDNERGIVIRDGFERITSRLNLSHSYSDDLELGMNLSLGRTINDRVPTGFNDPIQMVAQSPTTPAFDPETGEPNMSTLYPHALQQMDDLWDQRVWRSIGTIFANYSVRGGLALRTEFAADVLNQTEDFFQSSRTTPAGRANSRGVSVLNYNTNNYLTYNPDFGLSHAVNIVAGMSFQQSTRNVSEVAGEGFPTDQFRRIESAATITSGSSFGTGHRYLSYFSRLNYEYDDRYFASISQRIDGSSRFGVDNRFGWFPAASVGWILSNEEFWDSDRMSFLKVRGSYGETGNSEIGDFEARGLFSGAEYVGQSGIRPQQLRNPDLRWETTRQLDIGVDFALLNDRLSGEVDFYDRRTKDLLLSVNIPGSSGFSTVTQNLGRVTNRGVELLLRTQNLVGEVSWSTELNFSRNRNEVTELGGQTLFAPGGGGLGDPVSIAREGYPLGTYYMVRYAGVDPANGDALFYVRAGSDETTRNFGEAERQVVGHPHPRFSVGLTNRVSWGNVALDATFWAVRQTRYSAGGIWYANNQQWPDPQDVSQLRRWQQPGDITDVPQFRWYQQNGSQTSSRYLHDASFIRLRSVNLAYSVPSGMTERVFGNGGNRAKVFLRGTNLLTFTSWPTWDPEVDHQTGGEGVSNIRFGQDFYTAPQMRTFSIGAEVSF